MKVVHLSSGVSPSSANTKLHEALLKEGVNSKILALHHTGDLLEVYDVNQNLGVRLLEIYYYKTMQHKLKKTKIEAGIPFSFGDKGIDISDFVAIKNADVIHLHWICGFMSIRTIKKLIKLKKPIIWTCHDSWPFTGGCHVRYSCNRFEKACGKCNILHSDKQNDYTFRILNKKMKLWKGNQITFIAPSSWMKNNIKKSQLFSENRVEIIPNAICLEMFFRRTAKEIQDITKYKKEEEKIHILFGAGSVDIPYKGYCYLLEVLNNIFYSEPKLAERIVLHIIGAENRPEKILKRYCCKFWGYIEDNVMMSCIYSITDVFLYPSIDDNLPNMIMESMACGTPVVAFNVGGVPDLINHQENGYIAEYKNTKELISGLRWVITNNENNKLGINARVKVEREYGEKIVARKHIELYKELTY